MGAVIGILLIIAGVVCEIVALTSMHGGGRHATIIVGAILIVIGLACFGIDASDGLDFFS